MTKTYNIPEQFESKTWFIEKHLADLEHPLLDTLVQVLLTSDYACRQINLLIELLKENPILAMLSREDSFSAVNSISFELSQAHYMAAIRQHRHRQFLRLMLLEKAGLAGTEQVMIAWSDCADAIISHALEYIRFSLKERYGYATDQEGKEVILYSFAMGKLGGRELNYSSDIDLIFTYRCEGSTNGNEPISNQQYFTKMVQQFTHLLQTVTPEGFVFRVDLRLRPNGDSGPLVSSFAAIETYYQEQGRDWERYAMVKARVITEKIEDYQDWYKNLIIPFVYRRYVDFSVIESLRSMKAMIEREVQLNPSLNDIKRGQGGIREIEFIIQSFQLIRGGRLPALQIQNAMSALAILKQEQLLPRTDALKQAYLFLRKLENALQSLNDQQTHTLPDDSNKREQIILAMDFANWEQLIEKLQQYQRIVGNVFHSVLGKENSYADEKRLLANQLTSLWKGHVESTMAINLLTSLGYSNAPHCYQMIHAFRHSPKCRRLTQAARMRLDRFMVLLFTELTSCSNTDEILLKVIHLLESIVGRSAYLALLSENPPALRELLFWFANSPFISDLFVSQPFLLEILLDQDMMWNPMSVHELDSIITEKLSHTDDTETQEELLRQFKLTNWVMAARAELYKSSNAVRLGKFLADVAEVIVNQLVKIACAQLMPKYPEISHILPRFAIIAYGKLGSREMSYSSDLDLVFLHTTDKSEEALVNRLTQKILHMLTTRTQSGLLYQVDTRLRPSGSAGLLVSHLDAFVEYQQSSAWTWEHQALLKTRIISGNPSIRRRFSKLKQTMLAKERDAISLRRDVLEMRDKIDQHQESDPIKLEKGGLLDLEFLVQYLVLKSGDPGFSRYTHTLSLIGHLYTVNSLSKHQYMVLKKAYRLFHQAIHKRILRSDTKAVLAVQKETAKICDELYG